MVFLVNVRGRDDLHYFVCVKLIDIMNFLLSFFFKFLQEIYFLFCPILHWDRIANCFRIKVYREKKLVLFLILQ